jgi:hypothetical protein
VLVPDFPFPLVTWLHKQGLSLQKMARDSKRLLNDYQVPTWYGSQLCLWPSLSADLALLCSALPQGTGWQQCKHRRVPVRQGCNDAGATSALLSLWD